MENSVYQARWLLGSVLAVCFTFVSLGLVLS